MTSVHTFLAHVYFMVSLLASNMQYSAYEQRSCFDIGADGGKWIQINKLRLQVFVDYKNEKTKDSVSRNDKKDLQTASKWDILTHVI